MFWEEVKTYDIDWYFSPRCLQAINIRWQRRVLLRLSLGWEALMPPKSCSLFRPVPVTSLGESTSLFDLIICDTDKKQTVEIDLRHLIYLIVASLFFFVFFLSIHSGRMLNAPNTAVPTFTQSYQRQQPSLTPAPPPITHAMATIPHQPAYRAPTDRIFYLAHTCQPACLNRVRPAKPDMHRGKNPLLTPLLYDFRRMTGRRKVNRKVNMKEE